MILMNLKKFNSYCCWWGPPRNLMKIHYTWSIIITHLEILKCKKSSKITATSLITRSFWKSFWSSTHVENDFPFSSYTTCVFPLYPLFPISSILLEFLYYPCCQEIYTDTYIFLFFSLTFQPSSSKYPPHTHLFLKVFLDRERREDLLRKYFNWVFHWKEKNNRDIS